MNLKLRAKKLEEALAIVDSAGVRTDYEEAVRRIAELEAAQQPEAPQRLTEEDWEKIISGEWWENRDPHQRNTDYLYLFDVVEVNCVDKSPISAVRENSILRLVGAGGRRLTTGGRLTVSTPLACLVSCSPSISSASEAQAAPAAGIAERRHGRWTSEHITALATSGISE